MSEAPNVMLKTVAMPAGTSQLELNSMGWEVHCQPCYKAAKCL